MSRISYIITPIAPIVAAFEVKDLRWGTATVLESGQEVLIVTGILVPKGKWSDVDVTVTIDVHFLALGGMHFRKLTTRVQMLKDAGPVRFSALDKMLDNPPDRFCYTVKLDADYHKETPLRGEGK